MMHDIVDLPYTLSYQQPYQWGGPFQADNAFMTRPLTEQISCASTGSMDDRGDLLEIVIHRNPFLLDP